ncbi:DUF424 family protein [archaeon]|nr:DUF424 family protein [archaeon]
MGEVYVNTIRQNRDTLVAASICNIVGKKIVEAAIGKEMIQKTAIIYIGDIPHAQIIHL